MIVDICHYAAIVEARNWFYTILLFLVCSMCLQSLVFSLLCPFHYSQGYKRSQSEACMCAPKEDFKLTFTPAQGEDSLPDCVRNLRNAQAQFAETEALNRMKAALSGAGAKPPPRLPLKSPPGVKMQMPMPVKFPPPAGTVGTPR